MRKFCLIKPYVFIVLISMFLVQESVSQTLIHEFNFDSCILDDAQMNATVPTSSFGNPFCDCGPSGDAVYFDGTGDMLLLDSVVKEAFVNDFTLSFYFWVEDTNKPYNIFSIKKSECLDRDSTMAIRYIPISRTIEVDLIRTLGDRLSITAEVSEDRCWHHLALTKSGTNYSLFLDQDFIESKDQFTNYTFSDTSSVFIGFSPCTSTSESLFTGRIDELLIYDQAFNVNNLNSLNLNTDQIITENMTLFTGEGVQIETGGTCSNNFSWNPTVGLDDPNALEPFIIPPESTEYVLSINHGSCQVMDTIFLNVITEEQLDCDQLLLPKAFTPNGDNLNDEYGISNDFIVDELSYLKIFDRWGALVFETNNVDVKWDGSFKGEPMNSAMFVYKAKYICQGEEKLSVGSFSILR